MAPVLARGLLGEQLKLHIKKKEHTDVVVQQITIAPGGHTVGTAIRAWSSSS